MLSKSSYTLKSCHSCFTHVISMTSKSLQWQNMNFVIIADKRFALCLNHHCEWLQNHHLILKLHVFFSSFFIANHTFLQKRYAFLSSELVIIHLVSFSLHNTFVPIYNIVFILFSEFPFEINNIKSVKQK